MSEEKKSKWRQRLCLTVMVDKSFEEIFSFRFNIVSLLFVIGAMVIMLIAGVTVLIAFTGLREYIPGYPTGQERTMIIQNMQRADSLLVEVKLRDALLTNIRQVLSGELPATAFKVDSVRDEIYSQQKIAISSKKSEVDSLFRKQIEEEDRYNVSEKQKNIDTQLEMMYFYTPVKGIISNSFGDTSGHLGVDVVVAEGTRVSSILDGTVIFAEWTVGTGYVIQVQHDNQIISVYKHNSKLLKRAGMRVHAGEAIALTGNSGELSTGPHLHFELWYSGVPLNPEDYILFE